LHRQRRFSAAVQALARALELNPNFAVAHAFIGVPLAFLGARERAVESAQHAFRLSPNDRLVVNYASMALAHVYLCSGDYAESALWGRKQTENNPHYIGGPLVLTAALALDGDLRAAAEAKTVLLRLRPDFSIAWMMENLPPAGTVAERLSEGLRRVGVPET
jgi:tetratricopeptide (TPR) repeat protein